MLPQGHEPSDDFEDIFCLSWSAFAKIDVNAEFSVRAFSR